MHCAHEGCDEPARYAVHARDGSHNTFEGLACPQHVADCFESPSGAEPAEWRVVEIREGR